MKIDINFLSLEQEPEYESFLLSNHLSQLFYSLKYRDLLKSFLKCEAIYLLARSKGKIVGVLPSFLKTNKEYGNVLNSLPFYGSHGGVFLDESLVESNKGLVAKNLLNAFNDLCQRYNIVSATIVSNLYNGDSGWYEKYYPYTFKDTRIGQMTVFPSCHEDFMIGECLMYILHQKTRNLIRKAYKSEIEWSTEAKGSLEFLARVHKENINTLGGIAKSWTFFELIPKIFKYDKDYRVYIATLHGEKIAALLVFYYNKTVEYFTPAIVAEYRNLQPNSLLIFEAMKDAIKRGYWYWNWGGTSSNQESLHHFKERWGTRDYPYYYYTKVYGDDSKLKALTEKRILNEYPYFYVLPFSEAMV